MDSYKPLALNRLPLISPQTIENKGALKAILAHRAEERGSTVCRIGGLLDR
jgi:hypothetical protein